MPAESATPTHRVNEPYTVVLTGEKRDEGRRFVVRQDATLENRLVVRSAHSEGFWYLPDDRPRFATGEPLAVFDPHPDARFVNAARR